MKKITIKRILIAMYIVVLVLLALPTFTFDLGGKEIAYDGGDFLNIGINANFPSLKKGKDAFPAVRHTAKIIFDETQGEISVEDKKNKTGEILSILHTRLNYAKIEDIEVTAKRDQNNDFFIELTLPDNYADQKEYVSWILNTGQIDFLYFQGTAEDPENLSINTIDAYDYNFDRITVAQNIVLPIDENQGQSFTFPHLLITLKGKVGEIFGNVPNLTYQTLSSGEAVVRMNIGNQIYALYTEPQSDILTTRNLRALPIGSEKQYDDDDIINLLELTQSYFQSDAIEESFEILDSTKVIGATYNSEGGALMATSFALGSLMLCIAIFRKKGLRKAIIFSLTYICTILISIVIFKMLKYSISSGFIFGYIVTIPMIALTIQEIIKTGLEEKKHSNTRKIFLGFLPLFIYLTISILSGIDVFTYGISGGLFMIVLTSVLIGSIVTLFKSQPDPYTLLIVLMTIPFSLITNTKLNIELVQSVFMVLVITFASLSVTINLTYREIYRAFNK